MPTYPLTPPAVSGPAAERLRLVRVQAAMQSRFSGTMQVVDNFASWQLELSLARMTFADAERWAAFFDSLRGQIGTFRYAPWQSAASALTGRTLGATLNVYATSAVLAGWSGSAASDLRPGQFIQIGDQLLRLTAVPANATSGQCTVEFEPYARTTYASGTAVELVAPKGLFRLSAGDISGFQVDIARLPTFDTITCVEAI